MTVALMLAVAALTGFHPTVACNTTPELVNAAAYTLISYPQSDSRIVMDTRWCKALHGPTTTLRFVTGLLILAHEAGHVVRGRSESCAEQYGLSNWGRLGSILVAHWRPTQSQINRVLWLDKALGSRYHMRCV